MSATQLAPEVGTEASAILAMLVEVAGNQLDQQLESSDSHDAKALGLLAVDVGAVAGAIAVSPSWTPCWIVPIVLAVISALGFLETVRSRQYNFGPDLREFYERHGAGPLGDAQRFMLAQLLEAIDFNNGLLPPKARAFVVGLVALLLEVASGGVVLGLLDTGVLK
jgi:hypothetical protein